MANFVHNRICDRRGNLIAVLMRDEKGNEIPFILKNGKPVRCDQNDPVRPYVDNKTFTQFCNQAAAVLGEGEMAKNKKASTKLMSFKYLSQIEKDWLDLLDKNGIKYLWDGRLVIYRWEKKKEGLTKIPQIVKEIHSAIRMQDNILQKYNSEKSSQGRLHDIEKVLNYVHKLIENWLQADKEQKKFANLMIIKIIDRLSRCRDAQMQFIHKQLYAASNLKDCFGRDNPGAVAARLTASFAKLSERLENINLIASKIAFRRLLLAMEMERHDTLLMKIHINLFSAEKNIFEAEKEETNRLLNIALHYISKIYAMPYREAAKKIETKIHLAKTALWKDSPGLAYDILKKK
jgi:hypothetical protein